MRAVQSRSRVSQSVSETLYSFFLNKKGHVESSSKAEDCYVQTHSHSHSHSSEDLSTVEWHLIHSPLTSYTLWALLSKTTSRASKQVSWSASLQSYSLETQLWNYKRLMFCSVSLPGSRIIKPLTHHLSVFRHSSTVSVKHCLFARFSRC